MIRRVAFSKAVMAGAAGALAWELVARVLIWLRVPVFDLVYLLGTMVSGPVDAWKWWPLGMEFMPPWGQSGPFFTRTFFGQTSIGPRPCRVWFSHLAQQFSQD